MMFFISDSPAKCLSELMYEDISTCSIDKDIQLNEEFLNFQPFLTKEMNVCQYNVNIYGV